MELIVLLVIIVLVVKFLGSDFGGAVLLAGLLTWGISFLGVDGQALKYTFGVLLALVYVPMVMSNKKA